MGWCSQLLCGCWWDSAQRTRASTCLRLCTLLCFALLHACNLVLLCCAAVIALLLQLLSARNIDLASTAAEVVMLLALHSGGLGALTPEAVAGLCELLKECAAHAYALGLGRRCGGMAGGTSEGAVRRAVSGLSGTGESLQPIPELGQGGDGDPFASSSVNTDAAAEQAGAADRPRSLVAYSSVVMRHPSLNRDGTPGAPGALVQQAAAVGQYPAPFSSSLHHSQALAGRDRPRISVGSGALQCLVCAHTSHDSCGACPLSSALNALASLLRPVAELQGLLVAGGVLEVLVGLAASEAGGIEHSQLLDTLFGLMATAATGNSAAQDQVSERGTRNTRSCAVCPVCACLGTHGKGVLHAQWPWSECGSVPWVHLLSPAMCR